MRNLAWSIIAMGLAFCMVYALPISANEAEVSHNTILWQNNFDGMGDSFTYSGARLGRVDTAHGKSLMFDTTSGTSASITANMPEPFSDGIYALKIDYYTISKHIYNYVEFRPADSQGWGDPKNASVLSWTPIGDKISAFRHTAGVSVRSDATGLSYENQTWGDVVIWVDFTTRQFTYMVNGTLLDITGMPEEFSNIGQIYIYQEAGNYPGVMYMDNIELWHIRKLPPNPFAKEDTPEYLRNSVSIAASSPNAGNIFYDRADFQFETKFCNMGKSGDYTLCYSVENEFGDVVWNFQEKTFLAADETIIRQVQPVVKKYGMYTFKVLAECNGDLSQREFRCSKVNAPPEGQKNEDFGVSIHFDKDVGLGYGEPEVLLPLVDLGGFGMIRDESRWNKTEKQKGVYAFTEKYNKVIDYCAEHNIEILNILGTSNPLYSDLYAPLSGEYKKAFDGYVTYFVEQMEKRHEKSYFEGWNEFNLNAGSSYTPEDYAVLMKNMHAAVKNADADAFFVAMCTALTPLDWIERVLIALGDNPSQYMDAVSFHPYDNMHTPETGSVGKNAMALRALLDQYGCNNVEIWITELGWTSTPANGYVTEKQQGYYAPRMLLLNDARRYVDRYIWYDFHNDGISLTDGEKNWGLVRNELEDVPASAKYSYLTVVNYNTLVGSAEFKEEIRANEDCYMYRYKKNDTTDILALGTYEEGIRPTSLYVGCDKVTVYDEYGNPEEVSTVNGIVSLPIMEAPCYIEGEFCDRIYEVDALFSLSQTSVTTAANQETGFDVIKRTNLDMEVSVEAPPGIELVHEPTFVNFIAPVKLKVGNGSNGRIYVEIRDGDKLVYSQVASVEYLDSISISDFSIEVDKVNMRRRKARLTLENKRTDRAISGILRFEKPDCMKERSIEIRSIAPGEKHTVAFNFPELTLDVVFDELIVVWESDIGEEVRFYGDMKLPLAIHADRTPQIDGVLSPGEWNYDAQMDISGQSMVGLMQNTYRGHDDLSAVAYAMWDKDNFYFATKVKDDYFCQNEEPARSYMGDGIQLAFAENGQVSTGTELGISIYGSDCPIYCFTHTEDASRVTTLIKGEAAAVRDGIYTVYEARIPWSEIFCNGWQAAPGDHIAWSLLYNENDGSGRRGFLQYGEGIGSGKSPARYLNVELRK